MLDRALGRLSVDDTVIMLDLDHFKRVNDTFGHAAGDEVLRVFGRVLRDTVRGRDIVGRFGGEEFLIVLPPPGGADAFLRRMRTEWLTARPFPVTFSAGIAVSAGDPDETVNRADQALYQAKEAVDTGAALLLDLGRQGLLDGPRPSPGSDVARVSSDRTA
jgi:diguanylate cyclase (GGDEF)-like protein